MKKDTDKYIDRILGKKNCKIIKHCTRIQEIFDPPDPQTEIMNGFPLTDLLCDLTRWDRFMKLIGKEKREDVREFLDFRLNNIAFQSGIGIGFVLGNLFDIPYPEIQRDLKALKKLLIQERVLPYLPRRRRKERSH